MDYTQLFQMELGGLYGNELLKDMHEIINLYSIYEGPGQDWNTPIGLDYTPTKKKTNYIKKLIKEEARFLFGKTPEFKIVSEQKDQAQDIENYINSVLKDNLFSDKLIKAARDCFIGKRVALKLNASKDKGIKIMFVPSLEFVFETQDDNVDELKKIIFFYQTAPSEDKSKQRIWKQKYEMINGKCILDEGLYDGYGRLIQSYFEDYNTGLSAIPAYVIINDGLSGDLKGESDVKEILDNQRAYNILSSEDIDTLKKGMNQIIYGMDVDPDSIKNFKIAPGAFWDVQTDPVAEGKQARIDTIANNFGYDTRIENTLNRMKNEMHDVLNIPNLSLEQLSGIMTSGKSMKALYWQLITRCEEKYMSWRPALEWMVKVIIEMALVYNLEKLPKIEYEVAVENQYPLMEDEYEEKDYDMRQVNAQVMSRKSYIKKWLNIEEDIADEELKQIALERQLLEESYMNFEGSGANE